jgi:ketosteroid isomerase-like protein
MSKRTIVTFVVGVLVGLGVQAFSSAVRAGSAEEVRTVFERFVAAQNAHDLKGVGETLSDSKDFLWITRGSPIWGREAALQRFQALYQGTWRLDPAMADFKVIDLGGDSAQLFVPVTFMIAPAGQAAQPSRFLMNQTLVRTAQGWKIASILPILIPPQ